jgi:hypothetical protein
MACTTIRLGVIFDPDSNFTVCGLSDFRSLIFEPPTSMTSTIGFRAFGADFRPLIFALPLFPATSSACVASHSAKTPRRPRRF